MLVTLVLTLAVNGLRGSHHYFLDGHLMRPRGAGRIIAEYLGNRMVAIEDAEQELSGIESVEDEQCLEYA